MTSQQVEHLIRARQGLRAAWETCAQAQENDDLEELKTAMHLAIGAANDLQRAISAEERRHG